MIAREDIFTTVKTALEAETSLASCTVVIDHGFQHKEIESALRTGCMIHLMADTVAFKPTENGQADGATSGELTFGAVVRINPAVNAALSTPLVKEAIRSGVIKAIRSIAKDSHGNEFTLVSDDDYLDDTGSNSAIIVFSVPCQVNGL